LTRSNVTLSRQRANCLLFLGITIGLATLSEMTGFLLLVLTPFVPLLMA